MPQRSLKAASPSMDFHSKGYTDLHYSDHA
jgi:hypothetical protein